jgi:tRNA threonylcarbamoyladenosine biosynthesis protein TsaB
MAYILSLETATYTCSIAIHQHEHLLAVQDFHIDKSHSSLLHQLIRDMLRYCELDTRALSAVAISSGPGSYTGLRIGTSAAKGICFSLDIPLISVNTLEAMAFHVQRYNHHRALLCPMLDARRMEVYCQIRDFNNKEIMETQPVIVDEQSFSQYLYNDKVWFFGNGSAKCKSLLLSSSENAYFIEGVEPSASNIGALAFKKLQVRRFENIAYFVPNYLKEFRTTKPKKK